MAERSLILEEKISRVAELERAHANMGTIVCTGGGVELGMEETLDHVIGVLEAIARLDKDPKRIHVIK